MHDLYENPLIKRYASKEMAENFSDEKKFRIWRKLWLILAESQRELGIPISGSQIAQLEKHLENINYDFIQEKEKELKHDVMAHIHAYGKQCPEAMPILHLGATSAYVTDNADIIIMIDALEIIKKKLLNCISYLKDFALKYKDLPSLGYTHFQPAQLTTFGKRACLWIQDLLLDLNELDNVVSVTHLRGVKGTTGTQASFLTLFNQDHEKVRILEEKIVKKLGFKSAFPITSQTYPRKVDSRILNLLSSVCQSAGKFSSDLRLLQGLKEIEEPFEISQIGSSAMPYKRNPMRAERMASLARFAIINSLNPAITASSQWLERSLDDSANRRITIPQSFLATDAVLDIYMNITKGMTVYPIIIKKRVQEELPYMALESILMESVKRGGDRQALHEKLRVYSMKSAQAGKHDQNTNDKDLIKLISQDKDFNISYTEIEEILNPEKYIGRAPQQVEEFIEQYVKPALKDIIKVKTDNTELNV